MSKVRWSLFVTSLFALALFTSLFLTKSASAAQLDFLWEAPESRTPGTGANQLTGPFGVAADPDTGRIYVADSASHRVSVFRPWGAFAEAWGWDVAPEGAPGDTPANELEVCTTVCQQGSSGSGAGQLDDFSTGVTVDGMGAVYVRDRSNNRIQKFDSEGSFSLMFGGEVNKTDGTNICTKADLQDGDECGPGVTGVDAGQFSTEPFGSNLTYSPISNSIFVGDKDRIQEFGLDGKFEGKIDFEGSLAIFDGKSVQALAVDPVSGDLYLSFPDPGVLIDDEVDPNVYRLDTVSGAVVDVLEARLPMALAVDPGGIVYVSARGPATKIEVEEVLAFDSVGSPITGMKVGDGFAAADHPTEQIRGLATNICPGSDSPGNLYVPYVRASETAYLNAFGTGPIGCESPPLNPPEIHAQYAVSVGTDGAALRAQINPKFWPDATYYLHYGTEPCSEGGCVSQPASPGTSLIKKALNAPVATASVFLAGLEPDTTYHYRFVSQSGGSEGEDVIGVGGKPGVVGEEATFTTFPLSGAPETGCTNQVFRTGAGAKLPDCRAYEMVSPLEKNSGDIVGTFVPSSGDIPATLNQVAPLGDRLTYSSLTSFGDAESSPYISQYLSQRQALGSQNEGWSTQAISPPRSRPLSGSAHLDTEFKAFSEDLCMAWLKTTYDPLLGPDAVAGFSNFYRRDNCGSGTYQGLTPALPGIPGDEYMSQLTLQGASVDGSTSFYIAADDLPGSGAPVNQARRPQLYEYANGELRFVCILPNGNPTAENCYAGTRTISGGVSANRSSSLQNAVSEDGSRVFWTEASGPTGPGKIYLRIEGDQTIKVSQSVSNGKATFQGAAANGSRAIFDIEGFLYSFDTEKALAEEKPQTLIAKKTIGVMGVSDDASHVYFASSEEIAGSEKNSEGAEPQDGRPNLYLWREGVGVDFIATLSGLDTGGRLSAINDDAYSRVSRVTADGLHAAFMSRASLAGYDNIDALSGEAATEVFRYSADTGELACVSCNPSGARPIGKKFDTSDGAAAPIQIAAQIPAFESSFYAPRVLSDDGSRLFFESHESLVVRDTNGAQDVYQWEIAGKGSCDEGDSNFNQSSGGCVDLISTGESPQHSELIDSSRMGNDVFFTTLSSLYGPDYGLVDIYDARVGGGFPAPTSAPGCEGEACQGPLTAPDDPTPASSAFEGAGNVAEPPRPTKCAKGRRAVRKAGRTRCVKKPRKAKRAKRANKNRRAAR